VQTLCQDLRYGMRMLLKQSGFTLIAVTAVVVTIPARAAIRLDPIETLRYGVT
jgi:ABC-type lipoprotein release transport system permease subunit